MANAIEAMLKKQREKQNQQAAGRFFETTTPLSGKHSYRILPPFNEEGMLFQEWGQHWIPTEDGKKTSVPCQRKIFGDDHHCEVCDAISAAIRTASDDDEVKRFKDMYATQRFLVNVLITDQQDKKDEPQILEIGRQLHEQLEALLLAGFDDDCNITELEGGYNINITRTGTGMNTSYTATMAMKPSDVKPAKDTHKLDEVVKIHAAKSAQNALKQIALAAGALPPALENRTQQSLSDLRELQEDEDALEGVFEHNVSDGSISDSELDELDDLLN